VQNINQQTLKITKQFLSNKHFLMNFIVLFETAFFIHAAIEKKNFGQKKLH
jgi:hypothetical protein